MLTFLPALLVLGGRWAFWPCPPGVDRADPQAEHGIWARVARFVGPAGPAGLARPPPSCWSLLTFGLTQLGADGTPARPTVHRPHRLGRRPGGDRPALPGRHRQPGHRSSRRRADRAGRSPQVAPGRAPGVAAVRAVHRPARAGPPANAAAEGGRRAGAAGRHPGRRRRTATAPSGPSSDLRTAVHAVPGADAMVGGFTAINAGHLATPSDARPERDHPGGAGGDRGDPGPAAARAASRRCC